MKEKKLPLCESPIKVYSNYAYVLSVLLNNRDALNWFYSNFIQVKYIRDTENNQLFVFNYSLGNLTKYFYNIPYLEVRSLNRGFLLEICDDITKVLCKAIEEGYYIMTVVDEFYLPPRPFYKKEHYLHLIMINGFDMENEIFYSAGFNEYKYEETCLKFEDVFKAISSMKGNNKDVRDDYCMMYKLQEKDKIEYLRENYNYFPYKLNLKLIKRSLQEYLASKCSDEHFDTFYEVSPDSEYGISYYEAMIEYIDKFIEKRYEGNIYTVAFHGMLEHKIVMVQRLKFLQDNDYVCKIEGVINMYEEIATKAKIIRSLLIKYNFTKKINLLTKVKEYLSNVYALERQAVEALLELMKD